MKVEKILKRKELLQIVTKLHALFTISPSASADLDLKLTIKIAGHVHTWCSCEGHHGIKRAKAMSNFFVRHLMGTPLESIPLSNRYKRLVSKALLKCNSNLSKVYWVSVFSCFRLFKLKPEFDTSTITSRFKGRWYMLFSYDILSSLPLVKKSFTSAIDENWSATWKWHISGAAGPNGTVAYTRYLDDLRSLSHSRVGLYCLILLLTLPYVNKWETIKALRDALLDSLEKGDQQAIHSRLSFLSDKGGKTRVIAIVDILSQSLLKTVHHRCNLILRRLEQDGTFDQDQARRSIQEMSRVSDPLASIDLTAATDRMPVVFQLWVIVHLRVLTPLQALAWYLVTTRRDFRVSEPGKDPKYIRYAVGQPMGELSSWPVMAISHHYLVRLSYAATGSPVWVLVKAPYRVLGDDLTLLGFGVAEFYLKLISYLGMDYSKDKTYIGYGVAEFAKSLFCQGEDLTPFPLALLRYRYNTVVSTVQAILAECYRINHPITASLLVGLFPKRVRNLVLLAALSHKRPRSVLDLQPRMDQWFFQQFVYCQKIKSFTRLSRVFESTHAFASKDPGSSGKYLASPYLQIAKDNGESYPVRYLKDDKRLLNPEVLLGSNWLSYCTKCWPDGLPPVSDRKLIPGPTWAKERDDVIFRSSLLMFNKLMPNYFHTRCVGKEVGT